MSAGEDQRFYGLDLGALRAGLEALNERCGWDVETGVAAFVAQHQAPVPGQPRHRWFDDPATWTCSTSSTCWTV
jgi:hypothetical protein